MDGFEINELSLMKGGGEFNLDEFRIDWNDDKNPIKVDFKSELTSLYREGVFRKIKVRGLED